MPKTYLKNFCFNGLLLQVQSSDNSHLIWLEEFLCPQFEVIDQVSSYNCKVQLITDDNRYNNLLDMRPLKNNRIDAFAFDTRMIRLPTRRLNEDNQSVYHEEEKVFYCVNSDKTQVHIISPKKNKGLRKAAMRVIREFAMNHSHRKGDLIIHGAAFVFGNDGVIVAGPKGSGKTSLLICVLLNTQVRFAANDRVSVIFDAKGPALHGIPTIISIKRQTPGFFQQSFLASPLGFIDYRLNTNEIRLNTRELPKYDPLDSLSVSPAQFCSLLRVRPIARGNVRAIVFSQITGRKGAFELRELPPETSAVRLINCLFRADFTKMKSSLFDLATDNKNLDRDSLKERCHVLAHRVRCFDCYIGLEAYNDESTVKELVEGVLR